MGLCDAAFPFGEFGCDAAAVCGSCCCVSVLFPVMQNGGGRGQKDVFFRNKDGKNKKTVTFLSAIRKMFVFLPR